MTEPIPYPSYSKVLSSNPSDLFTYQWRYLRVLVMDSFLFLGLKDISFYTELTSCSHPQCQYPRRLHNLHSEGLTVFTSFCGFQGQNVGELLYTRISHFSSYFMNMLVFLKWELYSCLLVHLLILIGSYIGTHRKMLRTKLQIPPFHS